jgi:hypothetical protein
MNNKGSFKNLNDAQPASSLESISKCFNSMGLDFGYCTVGDLETKRTIVLQNTPPRGSSGSNIKFSLQSDQTYFSVSPDNGKPCLLHNSAFENLFLIFI